ncbi:MAG: M1 family metallopeptidase [Deltaproteobacteria bacterium]|nr:M1 family metallopeptidase [Deltaproteobacteria bacterium]
MSSNDDEGRGRHFVWTALAVVTLFYTCASVAVAESPRRANYTIEAKYDRSAQVITGRETIHWTNDGGAAAPELEFHLYWNAFANSRSSFVRATGTDWVKAIEEHPDAWGYSKIDALAVDGEDRISYLEFLHPDDDNVDDRTVAKVRLGKPVEPGASVDISVAFTAKLPRVTARAGYAGSFTFAGQWFPKLGVFENGSWNCHQYHLTTEFFADFGVYDVTLTLPSSDVVGATGVLREEHDNGDGTQSLRFVAEDVHDFAWTADSRFHLVEKTIEGTHVRLLIQPNHAAQAERLLTALGHAMRLYREWIAAYPYPELTIVDPGYGGTAAGGMEYPTLITVATTWWMPRGLRIPEIVTVHEFGHQYWYGLVATNEFEEAWLDEGVNSFLEGQIMDASYGHGSYVDLFGLKLGSIAVERGQYLRSPTHDPIDRPAWQFLDRQSYGAISYSKTALTLRTLAGQVSDEAVRRGLALYFERWRFKHPRGGDLLQALADTVGQDLQWLFDQLIPDTGTVDYAITRLKADEDRGFAGYPFKQHGVGEMVPLSTPPDRRYRSEIIVERLGTVRLPVDVQVVFDDGTQINERWDGQESWKRFEYTGPQRVEWAVVDPERKIPIDVNLINNSRMRSSGTRGIVRVTSRWAFWFQNLLHLLSGL